MKTLLISLLVTFGLLSFSSKAILADTEVCTTSAEAQATIFNQFPSTTIEEDWSGAEAERTVAAYNATLPVSFYEGNRVMLFTKPGSSKFLIMIFLDDCLVIGGPSPMINLDAWRRWAEGVTA